MGALSPDLAYLFTKLDDSSFSRSRDMIGPPKFKMSHVALTGPFRGWFVMDRLTLATVNHVPNLKSLSLFIRKI